MRRRGARRGAGRASRASRASQASRASRAVLAVVLGVVVGLVPGAAPSLLASTGRSGPARAGQQGAHLCRDNERLADCYQRLYDQEIDRLTEANRSEQSRRLAEAATGTRVGGAGSVITDLIPLLTVTGLLSNVGEDDDTGVISANINLPVFSGLGRDFQLRGTVDTSPELFGPLREALREDGRNARVEELLQGLDDVDDFSLQATYNRTSQRFGRAFEQHRELFDTLFDGVLQQAGIERDAMSNALLFQLQERLLAALPESDAPLAARAGELSPEERVTVEQAIVAAIREDARQQLLLERAYRSNRLPDFYRLLNNQPQLTVTATYRGRDELVGQDELGLEVGYEVGFANLDRFEERAGEGCARVRRAPDPRGQDSPGRDSRDPESLADCLDAFAGYVDDHAGTLENGDRLSLSVSYRRVGSYALDLPDDGVGLALPASDVWRVGLGYGRYLDPGATDDGRIDMTIDYENATGDTRNERFIASVTWTTKIGGLSVPLGIVYANRGELLGDVDAELGAHLGVKFDFGGGPESSGRGTRRSPDDG